MTLSSKVTTTMTMVIIPATYQWPIEFFTATTTTLYILSLITGNVSQVDRVWTFLPWIYTTYWTLMPLWPRHRIIPLWPYTPEDVPSYLREEYSPRALMMLGLVTLWMFRLSYNTWRRGFFNLHVPSTPLRYSFADTASEKRKITVGVSSVKMCLPGFSNS